MKSIEEEVVKTAYLAGEIMKEFRQKESLKHFRKDDASLVTEADLKIQDLFDIKLKELIPDSVIIGEENFIPSLIEESKGAKYVWILDPIDGTACFALEKCTEFGVGITLLENGSPLFSIFFAPELNKNNSEGSFYWASSERQSALLNGESIKTIQPPTINGLNLFLLGEKKFSEEPFEQAFCKNMKRIFPAGELASLARFCMLAGSNQYPVDFDLIVFRKPKIWDILTGAFILDMAGGKTIYGDGTSLFPFDFDKILMRDDLPRIPTSIGVPGTVVDQTREILEGVKD